MYGIGLLRVLRAAWIDCAAGCSATIVIGVAEQIIWEHDPTVWV